MISRAPELSATLRRVNFWIMPLLGLGSRGSPSSAVRRLVDDVDDRVDADRFRLFVAALRRPFLALLRRLFTRCGCAAAGLRASLPRPQLLRRRRLRLLFGRADVARRHVGDVAARHRLGDAPALVLRERPRLLDAHDVAQHGGVVRVVRLVALRRADDLAVQGVRRRRSTETTAVLSILLLTTMPIMLLRRPRLSASVVRVFVIERLRATSSRWRCSVLIRAILRFVLPISFTFCSWRVATCSRSVNSWR